MALMMRSSEIFSAWQSSVSTVIPSRSTVMRSATLEISFSLCDIIIDEMPCLRKSINKARSAFESVSFKLEVGSSRISSFTFLLSALAISTSCCLPVPKLVISVLGCSFSPTFFKSSLVRENASNQLITPFFAVSCPRKIFSAIESSGTKASS